jgi:hypothetical protein
MFRIPATKVVSKEKIFLASGTIFPVSRKMVSGSDTTVFVSRTTVPVSQNMVGASSTMFCDDH